MKRLFVLLIFYMIILYPSVQCENSQLPDSLSLLLQKNTKTDLNRVKALAAVSDYFFKQRQYKLAMPYINEIEEIDKLIDNNFIHVLTKYYTGSILMSKTQYQEAFKYLLSANHVATLLRESDDNLRLLIRTYISLGVCYNQCEMLSDAFECYKKGLELNKKLGDQYLNYMLETDLSTVYLSLGKINEGINIAKKLLSSPELSQDMKFSTYINIGINYINMKLYDSASMYLDTAYKCVSSVEDLIWVLMDQADIHRLQSNYLDAIKLYSICLDSLKHNQNSDIETNVLINLSRCYYLRHQYYLALECVDRCIAESENNNYLQATVNSYHLKAKILNDMGKYQNAYTCLEKFNLLNDSLYKVNNSSRIDQLELLYKIKDIEEKADIEQIVKERQHRQLNYIFFSVSLLLIAVIIIILLILNRKNIILKNRKIQEETISTELDLRNREMTAKMLLQVQKNELTSDIVKKLTDIELDKKKSVDNIRNVIIELKELQNNDSHEDFDYYFVQIHPKFYDNLRADFPDLTPYELRLCAYLKLNLNTKDIASISNISLDSAHTARSRLRKKLNINNQDDNLVNFLSKY